MKKHLLRLLLGLSVGLVAVSCKTPSNISYFQDSNDGTVNEIQAPGGLVIRKGDKIAVTVYSRDGQLASMFNLPYYSYRIGQKTENISSTYTQGVGGYLVNDDGNIDFPLLGEINVAGKTRSQLSALIKQLLLDSGMIKDPVVIVDFTNAYVSVMGEVARPGRIPIDRDDYTIFDALSTVGDLTINGERECVKVLREEDGVRKTYMLNLCSSEEVISSPVYYLHPNDVVYVTPNRQRKRQSVVNGNNVESVSFWMSVASLLVTCSYYFLLSRR